jgi:hypothetical protein
VSLTENNKYQFNSLWFDLTGLEFTALEAITITITQPIRFRNIGEKYSSSSGEKTSHDTWLGLHNDVFCVMSYKQRLLHIATAE